MKLLVFSDSHGRSDLMQRAGAFYQAGLYEPSLNDIFVSSVGGDKA